MKIKLLRVFLLFFCIAAGINSAMSQSFSSGTINMPIPDNGTTAKPTINVFGIANTSTSYGLESVCIDLNHTYDGQVIFYLIAPNGTAVELSSNNGWTGKNYSGTCFKMTANKFVSSGFPQAPFTGEFRPEGDLSKFNNGMNPNGLWQLGILDDIQDGNVGTLLSWSLNFSANPAVPFDFTSSNLPIVIINTNGKGIADRNKITADMGIIYNPNTRNNVNDPRNNYNGKIGIEFRGSSSSLFPKRSYSFETRDAAGNNLPTSLLGMPEDHDWALDASYADKSQIRNNLAYSLFAAMGGYAPRTRYVELILNGQYQGIYSITEKIKRGKERLNLAKLKPKDVSEEDITGGYIIKIDRLDGTEVGWSSNFKSSMKGDSAVFFQYYYPKADSITEGQKTYIKDYINHFESVLMSASFTDPTYGYRYFLDVNSVIDYFILTELVNNVDGYRLSQYLFKDKGEKLKIGPPWDYDISWGNASTNAGNSTSGWRYLWNAYQYFPPVWWKRLMQDPAFKNELSCRYKDLRSKSLRTSDIHAMIDLNVSILNEAKDRNFKQWPILGQNVWINPSPVPQTYPEEITYLKNWISGRLAWMDNNMPGLCSVGVEDLSNSNVSEPYPNPFNTSVNFNYKLNGYSNVKIALINSLGAEVLSVYEGRQPEGIYNKEINTDALISGVYFLKIIIDNQQYHKKLVKL